MDRKALLREALAADKQTIPQYLDYESPSVNVTEWLRYSCIPVYEQENAAKDPELASSMEKALSLIASGDCRAVDELSRNGAFSGISAGEKRLLVSCAARNGIQIITAQLATLFLGKRKNFFRLHIMQAISLLEA